MWVVLLLQDEKVIMLKDLASNDPVMRVPDNIGQVKCVPQPVLIPRFGLYEMAFASFECGALH